LIEGLKQITEDADDYLESWVEYVNDKKINIFETKNRAWLEGLTRALQFRNELETRIFFEEWKTLAETKHPKPNYGPDYRSGYKET